MIPSETPCRPWIVCCTRILRQVIHTFTGRQDGGFPYDLTTDAAGNLYGPAECCDLNYGAVYEVERLGSFWLTSPLYDFKGGNDASLPGVGVVFGPDGLLYGTTYQGGTHNNGTVFSLGPAPGVCQAFICPRTETVLYSFGFEPDVAGPTGEMTFDQQGNIYGTAQNGPHGGGGVYELVRAGNDWIEQIIYGFPQNGGTPFSGVIFDASGNLYGTTTGHGLPSGGSVFQLVPSNGGWTQNVLYHFQEQSDGYEPHGGLTFDQIGMRRNYDLRPVNILNTSFRIADVNSLCGRGV